LKSQFSSPADWSLVVPKDGRVRMQTCVRRGSSNDDSVVNPIRIPFRHR